MDKVTKERDPKQQAAGRKAHGKYMAKLKEDILKNVGSSNGGSSSSNTTNIVPMVVSILPTIVPLLLAVVVP